MTLDNSRMYSIEEITARTLDDKKLKARRQAIKNIIKKSKWQQLAIEDIMYERGLLKRKKEK